MKIGIQIALLIVAGALAFFIYDGIQDKIDFRDMSLQREKAVHNRLKDVVKAQKKFKEEKARYASNFPELLNFINNDSLTIIKAIGNVPDSLTEVEAVARGIVIRDTSLVPATTIFADNYPIDSLPFVPNSGGEEFKIQADVIEKNKVNVNVFEVSTTLKEVYTGLDTKNEAVKLDDIVKVGSMYEPITTGNW